jgi:asparagine synthase (glutamine-hydrolysing)
MPNLVGIFRPDWSQEQIQAGLASQLERVRTPARQYAEYTYVSAGFGMALQDHGVLENGRQPAVAAGGRLHLLLDGEIYNQDELARRYRDELALAGDISAPELCLRLIERYGAQIAHEFNGLFAIAIWDEQARRLRLITDHFGFRPVFHAKRANEFLFATELKAIRAAERQHAQVDEAATFELFCYGSQVFGQTWIRDYVRLTPATVLTVDASVTLVQQYWTYCYEESAPVLDQETYTTVFATLLDRAVERCMKGSKRIGIFLSGGYDSRSVAASIRGHHLPIPAFTFGYPESRDVRFARQLCERLGLEHRPVTRREPYLYRYCRSIVWRTEGLLPFSETSSIRFHSELVRAMDIFLTGLLAEFSGSHTWPRLLLARNRREAMRAITDRFFTSRLPFLRRIFSPRFYERAKEAAASRLRTSFDAVKGDHPLNIADSWNLMHVQPMRSYQAPSIDRHVMEMRAPHMDFELVSFLLTIPPYARLEQRVYKKMIAYRFPRIRDVPCTNSGVPVDPNFVSEYVKMVARYTGRKLATPIRRLMAPSQDLGRESDDINAEFRQEPQLVDRVLLPAMQAGFLPSEIFDHAGIAALIKEQYDGHADHAAALSSLVTYALAYQFFIADDFREVPEETRSVVTVGGAV